jgi:hypothetical protein
VEVAVEVGALAVVPGGGDRGDAKGVRGRDEVRVEGESSLTAMGLS